MLRWSCISQGSQIPIGVKSHMLGLELTLGHFAVVSGVAPYQLQCSLEKLAVAGRGPAFDFVVASLAGTADCALAGMTDPGIWETIVHTKKTTYLLTKKKRKKGFSCL